ncbi:MAG: 2-oxoglutarate dehydrogenase, E2 component, dihydrolipoamide succinyltransferase [Ornithinimicrobium sp.]
MSERVSMPALGESVTEGTVTRWLKSVGDEVEVDEPLLEVSTDKVDTEIPSPVAGVLQEVLAEEDDVVEVGGDLAVIGDGKSGGESGGGDASADESEAEDSGSDGGDDGDEEEDDGSGESDEGSRDADSGHDGGSSSGSGGGGDGETVTMPALGESVTEGTVTRWLKEEGDDVELDEPLLEVSTDKVDTEIPSPVAGKLTKILAAEDDVVEVGGDLAVVGGEAASTGDSASDADSSSDTEADDSGSGSDVEADSGDEDLASEQKLHEEAGEESAEKNADSGSADKGGAEGADKAEVEGADQGEAETGSNESSADVSAYVTPLVRKLAAKHDVDLGSIEGTGVGGRIRKQDVLDAGKAAETAKAESDKAEAESAKASAQSAASESTKSAPSSSGGSAQPSSAAAAKRGKTEKMSRLRKVIATRMVESLHVSAQLTTVVEVDVTKVSRLRAAAKADFLEREGVKLSFMPFFALAAIEALKQHPTVNSSIDGDEVTFHARENLGVAVDTEKGLIVPVIKDAGDLNIAGLARKIAELAERTRTNKIGPDDLGGGTFTLTNTGSRGALFDTPILNQPQVGILGTGSVVKRPVVHTDSDGQEAIAIRSMVYLALTYDHRIVDGADAARFLTTMKTRLEDASFEV